MLQSVVVGAAREMQMQSSFTQCIHRILTTFLLATALKSFLQLLLNQFWFWFH